MLNDYSMKENHMSKNYFKTEEVPPLKKSIIHKVEKQYGKDNPKTYATLWSIYKKKKKNEDAPTNSTGPSVAGTGDDSSTVLVKKRKELQKRLMRRFSIKETLDKILPDPVEKEDELTIRKKQLKELAKNRNV